MKIVFLIYTYAVITGQMAFEIWASKKRKYLAGDVANHVLVAAGLSLDESKNTCAGLNRSDSLGRSYYYYRAYNTKSYGIYVTYLGEDHLYECAYNQEDALEIMQRYNEKHLKHNTGCVISLKLIDESDERSRAHVDNSDRKYGELFNHNQCNCPNCRQADELPGLVGSDDEPIEDNDRDNAEQILPVGDQCDDDQCDDDQCDDDQCDDDQDDSSEDPEENDEPQQNDLAHIILTAMMQNPLMDTIATEYVESMVSGTTEQYAAHVGCPLPILRRLIIRYFVDRLFR